MLRPVLCSWYILAYIILNQLPHRYLSRSPCLLPWPTLFFPEAGRCVNGAYPTFACRFSYLASQDPTQTSRWKKPSLRRFETRAEAGRWVVLIGRGCRVLRNNSWGKKDGKRGITPVYLGATGGALATTPLRM